MDHAFVVGLFERRGHLVPELRGFFVRDGAFLHALGQRGTFDQLHHQIIGSDVEQGADVGVVQLRDHFGFACESLREFGVRGFDGDLAFDARIEGAVHLAHASCAQEVADFVGTELVAGGQGHADGTILSQGRDFSHGCHTDGHG
jgi:hypothetical protein